MKIKWLIVGALLMCSVNANAGWFDAGWKPKPNITLFGQTLTWPLPSICLGAKAGVLPDAGASPDGINLKIPYLALDFPFPKLTVSVGKDKPKIELKLGSVDKTEHKPE